MVYEFFLLQIMIAGGLADLSIIETNLGLFLKTILDIKSIRYVRIIFCTLLIAPTTTIKNFSDFNIVSYLGTIFLFVYYIILLSKLYLFLLYFSLQFRSDLTGHPLIAKQ